MRILITICARGGSKGIPKKNIRELGGRPLIGYSILIAQKFKDGFSGEVDIALSTDSEEIKQVASTFGLVTDYVRPEHLANDTAGKVDAITDIKNFFESKNSVSYDFVLDLDVSSPLRTIDDLFKAFEIISNNTSALNLFSVNKANKNPYFNMVEQGENGFYFLSKSLGTDVLSRQNAPQVYEVNASFYFYRASFFYMGLKSVLSGKALIFEMDHTCFDLDHEIDFDFMDFLVSNDKLGFKI
jgi:CMP-N-acetylneuraminic acid synthetase